MLPKTKKELLRHNRNNSSLYNNVISLDFEDLLPTITISIINETTGVTIYLENYNNLNSIIIDLSTEKSGYYLIRIEYDDIILEGNFVLE